jgi:hypothetical protein
LRDLVAANGGELRMTEEQIFEEFGLEPEPASARAIVNRLRQAELEMKPSKTAEGEHEMTLKLPMGHALAQEGAGEKHDEGADRWRNQTYIAAAAQTDSPDRNGGRKGRRRWFLSGIGAVLILALVGAGVWYVVLRDTGPSEAEKQAEAAKKQQALDAAARAQCQSQLGGLISAEEDLEGRLSGAGLTEADYMSHVGDVSAAHAQVPFKQLQLSCVTNAGVPAENALNAYVSAANTWNDCVTDLSCSTDSIDPQLQAQWNKASAQLASAKSGLNQVQSP